MPRQSLGRALLVICTCVALTACSAASDSSQRHGTAVSSAGPGSSTPVGGPPLSSSDANEIRRACIDAVPAAMTITPGVAQDLVGHRVDVCLINPNDVALELPVRRIDPWLDSEQNRAMVTEASPDQPIPAGAQVDSKEILLFVVGNQAYRGRSVVRASGG